MAVKHALETVIFVEPSLFKDPNVIRFHAALQPSVIKQVIIIVVAVIILKSAQRMVVASI